MTAFCMLPTQAQLCFALVLFLISLSTLALCFYRYICHGKLRGCVFDAFVFSAEIALLSVITVPRHLSETENVLTKMPIIIYAAAFILMLSYSVISIFRLRRKMQLTLSPLSVKEAFDNLNSGVCFSDTDGRIVLINKKMNGICELLSGNQPQLLSELEKTFSENSELSQSNSDSTVRLCRARDGRVYRLTHSKLDSGDFAGYTQTNVFDVTEIFKTNERLGQENTQLKLTNEKLTEMYEIVADRIREEETLNLRIKVHDDIGASLIAISALMSDEKQADMDTQLRVLQNAVSYFESSGSHTYESFEELSDRAEHMNVTLQLDGRLPETEEEYSLCVLAAGECVTNCVRHAGGNLVKVKVDRLDSEYIVSYTNNGKKPDGQITEGGGLSALRKRVEAAGSKMTVEGEPEFRLILKLPVKEKEND